MERLRDRDLEAVNSCLREVYAEPDLEGFGKRVVSVLSRIIPSDLTTYNEYDFPRLTNTWVSTPVEGALPNGPGDPGSAEMMARHMSEYPVSDFFQVLRERDGRVAKISDFANQRQWHRAALYNDVYRAEGMNYSMGASVAHTSLAMAVVLVRSGGTDYSERERLMLGALQPHLAQARENAAAMTRVRRRLSSVQRAMEDLDRGGISLSPEGRVRWCTERTRGWLSGYCDPPAATDRLPEDLSRWVEHQRVLLSKKDDASLRPPEPLVLEAAGKTLTVRLVSDDPEDGGPLLALEERDFSPRRLKSFGLTRRESEVLRLAAQGKTEGEIAAALYISPRTVSKHLEHAYRKLGVESRRGAAARVL